MASYGFVYFCRNRYMPNVVKIGYTDRAPMQRMVELSASTSIPDEFKLICYAEFDNAKAWESEIHSQLKDYRINVNREFFELNDRYLVFDVIPWIEKNAINSTRCAEFNLIEGELDAEDFISDETPNSDQSEVDPWDVQTEGEIALKLVSGGNNA